MAVFTVTTTGDSGAGSLRDAISRANANPEDADTIVFASSLAGQTITLIGGQLTVSASVTIDGDIDGDNKADITISGNDNSRIFELIGSESYFDLRSVTLTRGLADAGGAIRTYATTTLVVRDSTIIDNCASVAGSAVYAGGAAHFGSSLITGNETINGDGALYYAAGISYIQNSTIYGNEVGGSQASGLVVASGATVTVVSSTIFANENSDIRTDGLLVIRNSIMQDAPIGGGSLSSENNAGTTANFAIGELLDNGGTVLTAALLDGATTAIDQGGIINNDLFDIDGDGNSSEALPLDGRYQSRVYGSRFDIGAVEYRPDETIRGTDLANNIIGGLGKDKLYGRGGDDTLDGGADDDQLYGDVGADTLRGGANSDLLSGGADVDYLDGGSGDDTYVLGSEATGVDTVVDISGNDIITSLITRSLAPFEAIENLRLEGTAAIDGTGNPRANEIQGNSAANRLDGGSNADRLIGLAGNDTYIVDNANDVVIEVANQGTDRVSASVTYALAAGQHVERMSTTQSGGTAAINLTGNELVQEITGNAGNNRLDGRGGADILIGGLGNDTLIVDNANDVVIEAANQGTDRVSASVSYVLAAGQHIERMSTTSSGGTGAIDLTGNERVQEITGNAGNNRLDGRGGADILIGGLGNDTLIVDNANDVVIEAANQGTDRVSASVSYVLAAGQHVERMSTTSNGGTDAIDLTGNERVQEITGNAGSNRLDGKGGADTLKGFAGNDTYIVDNASDIVIEAANQGTDRVSASVSYALAAGQHIERMTTTNSGGIGAINLTGNEFNQEITGNAGANRLTGGGGQDKLTGAGGNDIFDFNAVSESGTGAGTREIITDFTDSGGQQDKVRVSTIDANTTNGAVNDAFVLDTNNSFSTGEIRQTLINGGADLLLEFNNDADAAADMSILLQGRTTFVDAADLVL